MLYDHRTYTCRPGTLKLQLELYEKLGWETQRKHLGDPVYYATTETGNPNVYVHVWVYQDAADRAKRRAAMQADPAWQAYLKASAEAGYLIGQQNALMQPVSFFPGHR
jgi:hypothetical protein